MSERETELMANMRFGTAVLMLMLSAIIGLATVLAGNEQGLLAPIIVGGAIAFEYLITNLVRAVRYGLSDTQEEVDIDA